eukprot:3070855-Prymnesium_polylepis.1
MKKAERAVISVRRRALEEQRIKDVLFPVAVPAPSSSTWPSASIYACVFGVAKRAWSCSIKRAGKRLYKHTMSLAWGVCRHTPRPPASRPHTPTA